MKIHVLQEDIDNGVRRDPYACALALAIKREVGPNFGVNNLGGNSPVERFVADFDAGLPVEPTEFDLPLEKYVGMNDEQAFRSGGIVGWVTPTSRTFR